ncbi:MAG: aminoglycoside phosphotransferase family protein [Clostridia bacterium]|nr:aminoglycoside phosphotransferase family protein [Clostridia bacterium]
MQTYFTLDENFNNIIDKELKENFNVKTIDSMQQISTGWTNIVYKVKTNNGNYYFRFPRDDFWEKTIVKDYQFAKYIQGKTSFTTVDLKLGYSNNRPFSIHKEIEGVALAEKMNELNSADIEKIANQLAKFMHELHNIEYDEKEIFSINNIGLELQDFITELLAKHVSKEDNEFWAKNNFKINPNEQCLVHGDFNSSNVLLDEKNNVTAIIDFGFGGFGSKSQDISRIIGRCPEQFKNPIINAYEKYANQEIEKNQLNQDIKTWSNIDNAYINYMTKIGIYKR